MNIPEDKIDSGYGQRRWVFSTFYGKTEAAVREKCRRYMEEWPSQGYDTHIATNMVYPENDYYLARMQRWSTCS